MEIISSQGNEELAKVYVAKMRDEPGYLVEFAESIQPPFSRDEKWVLIISTLYGCPIKCLMCDACGTYNGRLEVDEMLAQIDFLIKTRFPDGKVRMPKFKIQFARMGEPALNPNVLKVLRELPERYDAPGLMPCISSVAPAGGRLFFEDLMDIKNELYPDGRFQLQFSIHTTDLEKRDELMPINKWTLREIGQFGDRFWRTGDRKITLNFAMADGFPVVPKDIRRNFSPDRYIIKLTPINPTKRSVENNLRSMIDPEDPIPGQRFVDHFRSLGFETILSIGELDENEIGSNCGMYIGSD